MTPNVRKLALTIHVVSSVGWLGAVAVFLALALAGMSSGQVSRVQAAYVAMDLTAWYIILPLSFAALISGVVQSVGTSWGLFRHYWVVAKLLITVVATGILLVHMQAISQVAKAVTEPSFTAGDLHGLRVQLLIEAGAALVALLSATALSVFKPRGLTRYGRKQAEGLRGATAPEDAVEVLAGPRRLKPQQPRIWAYVLGVCLIVLAHVVVIKHLSGGGFGHAQHLGSGE